MDTTNTHPDQPAGAAQPDTTGNPWPGLEKFAIGVGELIATGVGAPKFKYKIPTEKASQTVQLGRSITFTEEVVDGEIVFKATSP